MRVQARVIWALLMREVITRYGRHNIGFLWMLVEPIIFTLSVIAVWTYSGGLGHRTNLSVAAFAITGYSSALLWRNPTNRCCLAIQPNLALMYHSNVKVLDIYIVRISLEIFSMTMSFATLGLFFIFIGWMQYPEDIMKVLEGWFMLAWFAAALAVTIGSLSELSEVTVKIWHPVGYFMFILSGVMFMVDWLPDSFQKIILYVPMVHGLELLREGYFGSAVHAHYDISYMATVCLCLTYVGLSLTKIISRKVSI